MSKIACPACSAQQSGVKTQADLKHTCWLQHGANNEKIAFEKGFVTITDPDLIRGYMQIYNEPPKSGFFDYPESTQCTHPEHNPPMHMVIPQGQAYRHVCPKCYKETVIVPPIKS